MNKNKILLLALFTLSIMVFGQISATNTFPYVLTQADVPSGYTLKSSVGDAHNSSQYWITPSDPTGSMNLNVTEYQNSTQENAELTVGIFGGPVSINGADVAYNVTFFVTFILAKRGSYLVQCGGLLTNYSEEKVLVEAQLAKLPASSSHKASPGFTLPLALISMGILALVYSKKRKLL